MVPVKTILIVTYQVTELFENIEHVIHTDAQHVSDEQNQQPQHVYIDLLLALPLLDEGLVHHQSGHPDHYTDRKVCPNIHFI
jgi:hypothetical protein